MNILKIFGSIFVILVCEILMNYSKDVNLHYDVDSKNKSLSKPQVKICIIICIIVQK